jgi:CheY-like chemotaxis protein
LSTVYGIVQSLGGTIAVDSAPGRGTAFTIRLRSAPKTQAIEAASERPSSATSDGTETILLVEDDQSVRELTARLLREAGYRVLEAPSSRRALALVKDTAIQVDLLLIDVMLPGLNGVELFDVLRGSRRHARVLYMTGYSDQAISRAGAAIDNGALLTKPFTPNGLLQRIRDVLDKTAAS